MAYICPYSKSENNRLDQQHKRFSALFGGKLFLCASEDAETGVVLDVGTGSGAWAKDFVTTFPRSSVIGFDTTPLLPLSLPGCSFRNADFHHPWPAVTQRECDLVHARLLFGSIRDTDFFVKEAYNKLKPGAYIEFQEIEFPWLHEGHSGTERVDKWCDLMQKAALRRGLDLQLPRRHAKALAQAGFTDIEVKTHYTLPIGEWPPTEEERAIGRANRINLLTGLDGFSRILLLSGELRLAEDEYDALLRAVETAIRDDALRLRQQVFVIWARKPELNSVRSEKL